MLHLMIHPGPVSQLIWALHCLASKHDTGYDQIWPFKLHSSSLNIYGNQVSEVDKNQRFDSAEFKNIFFSSRMLWKY